MSSPEINQVLAQMRVLQAQAATRPLPEQAAQAEFGDLLKQSINAVNSTQQNASALRSGFERGEAGVELVDVMITAQKSSLAFQAMVEVRNKLVEAYKDVMNMPV
jgi:flagellar hook-basal body complex protein FliE